MEMKKEIKDKVVNTNQKYLEKFLSQDVPENLEKHRILTSAKIKIEHHYRIRKKFADNKNRNLNICNRFMLVGARVNLHKIENAPQTDKRKAQ